MEVKIKSDKGMVDATIEMVDGVILVYPVEDVDLKPKKWKPGVDETFYFIEMNAFTNTEVFCVECYTYCMKEPMEADKDIKIGNCFKTKEEAQKYCDRLNEEVRKVKEEML